MHGHSRGAWGEPLERSFLEALRDRGSARRGPNETTPRGPEDGGQLRPELSPAYRNFRHAMNLDGPAPKGLA